MVHVEELKVFARALRGEEPPPFALLRPLVLSIHQEDKPLLDVGEGGRDEASYPVNPAGILLLPPAKSVPGPFAAVRAAAAAAA